MIIDDVKLMLDVTDNSLDNKLNYMIQVANSRLKLILGTDSVPEELEYIVTEVVVKRFNRIGSEGYSSHSVEGESFSVDGSDFEDYAEDINAWRIIQKDNTKGVVRFL